MVEFTGPDGDITDLLRVGFIRMRWLPNAHATSKSPQPFLSGTSKPYGKTFPHLESVASRPAARKFGNRERAKICMKRSTSDLSTNAAEQLVALSKAPRGASDDFEPICESCVCIAIAPFCIFRLFCLAFLMCW